MSTLFAFLHHLCAFTLVGAIAIEFTLVRQELSLASARRLLATDLVLGIAAGLLLVIGLLRVFFFEKGAAYYWHSHAFLIKFSLFVIVGLLSIIPTREFLSWRGAIKAGQRR
jgi:putative membrane protein